MRKERYLALATLSQPPRAQDTLCKSFPQTAFFIPRERELVPLSDGDEKKKNFKRSTAAWSHFPRR